MTTLTAEELRLVANECLLDEESPTTQALSKLLEGYLDFQRRVKELESELSATHREYDRAIKDAQWELTLTKARLNTKLERALLDLGVIKAELDQVEKTPAGKSTAPMVYFMRRAEKALELLKDIADQKPKLPEELEHRMQIMLSEKQDD